MPGRKGGKKQGQPGTYLTVRWEHSGGGVKAAWERVCQTVFGMNVSDGTRVCLTEILSCYLSDEELDELHLKTYKVCPPPLLRDALLNSLRRRAKAGDILKLAERQGGTDEGDS